MAQKMVGQGLEQRASILILSLLILNKCSPLIIPLTDVNFYDGRMRSELQIYSAEYIDR